MAPMTQRQRTLREPEAETAPMDVSTQDTQEAAACKRAEEPLHEQAVDAGKKRIASVVSAQNGAAKKQKTAESDANDDTGNSSSSSELVQESQSDNDHGSDDGDVVMESDNDQTESEPDTTASREQPEQLDTSVSEERGAFHKTIKQGEEVDVYCVRTKFWLPAKIEVKDETKFRVHFMGWNKKSDEDITLTGLYRIAPRGEMAASGWKVLDDKKEKYRLGREKKAQALLDRYTAAMAAGNGKPAANKTPESTGTEDELASFIDAGASRSGRRLTKRIITEGAAIVRKKPSESTTPKKTAEEHAREVQQDNLCGACGEYEDDALTDMVMCDGGCLTSYHFSCIGIDQVPDEETWLCEQCRTNEQQCFQCGRNCTIGEKGGVFRCSIATCGKFYHQKCVDTTNKHFRRLGRGAKTTSTKADKASGAASTGGGDAASVEPEEGDDDDDQPESLSSFRCPRHVCAVCENTKKAELMQCLKCPEAYHPHCVPPSARYNNLGLLCYRHSDDKLPRIPPQYLVDRNFDSVVVDFNLRLPVLFLPKNEPLEHDLDDCHHFRLQLSLMDQVKKEPPTFRKLVRNIYTFKQQKESLEDVPLCVCKTSCGDDCINRLSFTECFGPAPMDGAAVPLKAVERREKENNCLLGEECGNRALHQRIYPQFDRFYSTEKGWGLKVKEHVKPGQLVIEYVGEVINEEEKDKRLNDHARLHPQDKNMYIMELSKGVYIDARHKGSVSRFINHSCDPNCRLLKWNVRGVNRIAITAIKEIAAGEELTYDYQFHTSQALEWRCFCKAKNCRGTMAPGKLVVTDHQEDDDKKMTKKEKAKKMKRAMQQEKMNQKKDEKEMARRLSLTAPIARTIARTGPAARELAWAKLNHVFLKRNAEQGFDFLARRELVDKRMDAKMRDNQRSSTAAGNRTTTGVKSEEDKEDGEDSAASTVSTDEVGREGKGEATGVRLKVVARPAQVAVAAVTKEEE